MFLLIDTDLPRQKLVRDGQERKQWWFKQDWKNNYLEKNGIAKEKETGNAQKMTTSVHASPTFPTDPHYTP